MTDIKIIFFDIDGTLISKQTPHLTGELKTALKALQDKGIKICIATGRHIEEINELGTNREFDFDAFVTLNGNYCHDAHNLIYSNEIDRSDVLSSLAFLREHRLPCRYVEEKTAYINFINKDVEIVQESIHSSLPPVMDIERAAHHAVYQICPYFKREIVAQMLACMPHCKATSWHPSAFDIVKADSGKDKGIAAVLNYYSLKLENVMAFGDGENDTDMLDFAAHAVVMGNADERLREHGDFVTKTIDDGGVLYALKHYGLI